MATVSVHWADDTLKHYAELIDRVDRESPIIMPRIVNQVGNRAKTIVIRNLTKQTGLPRKTIVKAVGDLDFDGDEPGDADNVARFIMADEDEAGEHLDARKRESKREAGSGTVELDLTVDAVAEGQMTIEKARAGVDGTYRIESVKHKANRSGGATTTLELKEPGGGAGKDGRKKGQAEPEFALPRSETLG